MCYHKPNTDTSASNALYHLTLVNSNIKGQVFKHGRQSTCPPPLNVLHASGTLIAGNVNIVLQSFYFGFVWQKPVQIHFV